MTNKKEERIDCTSSHFSDLEDRANATRNFARRVSENINTVYDLICVKNHIDIPCDEKAYVEKIPVNRIIGVQDVVKETNDSLDDIDFVIHKIIALFK